MKNNKKKSPTMKIMSAATMLAVSAAMLGTSTYAWFTMNKDVQVKNLAVKAKAEGGLLISEMQGPSNTWDDEANSTVEVAGALAQLYPTSTANGVAWYHATSKTANDAADASQGSGSIYKASGYTNLTSSLNSKQIQAAADNQNGKKDVFFTGSGATEADYYVKYTYYLKTSSDESLDNAAGLGTISAGNQNVAITEVTVDGVNSSGSAALDKALRIGIEMGGKFYIFAPVSGSDLTYYVNAGSTETTAIDSSSSHTAAGADYTMIEPTALNSLPGRADNGTPVYIYMWYEGEDQNCKSDNITSSLDTLTVNVRFSLLTLGSGAADHGVSMS